MKDSSQILSNQTITEIKKQNLRETDDSYGKIISNTEIPENYSLVKKFRKIFLSEINSAEIIKLINQFALLKESDLENEKIKSLFENLKISNISKIKSISKIKNFKNISNFKNLKKYFKIKKNVKFCSKYNSVRKLFILFLTKIDPSYNLFYTNYVNNLCIDSPNEYLKSICIFYASRMNLDENTLRKIVETLLEEKNLNPSLIPLLSFFDLKENILTLHKFMQMDDEEFLKKINLKGNFMQNLTLDEIANINFCEDLKLKKILDSEISYKYLKDQEAVFPSFYLNKNYANEENLNALNLKIGINKITEFILKEFDLKNRKKLNLKESFLVKFISLCMKNENQSVKFEALKSYILLSLKFNSEVFNDLEEAQENVSNFIFKYKNKRNKILLNKEKLFLIKDNLLSLNNILFYEILRIFKKDIFKFIDQKELEKKVFNLIDTFKFALLKLDLNFNDEIKEKIYFKCQNYAEKIKVLKEINKITNKELLKKSDNKELNKIKLEKIRNLEENEEFFYFLEDENNFEFSLEVFLSPALFFHIKKIIEENKLNMKIFSNIQKHPDFVCISLIKILRKFKLNEKKENVQNLFKKLLNFSEKLSYEKYTTVFICNGEVENCFSHKEIDKFDRKIDNVFDSKKYLDNLILHNNTIYGNTNNENIMHHHQLSSFSEILFIESTYKIKKEQIEFSVSFINQSMLLLSEINFYVLSDLKIDKAIQKFSLSKRSIEKKIMQLNFKESKEMQIKFFVEFQYTKKGEKVKEFLNLKDLKINQKFLLKNSSTHKLKIENWEKKRWERKISFKNISKERIKKFEDLSFGNKIETENYSIFNAIFEMKNTEILLNCVYANMELKAVVRGEEKSLVEGFCEFFKNEILN